MNPTRFSNFLLRELWSAYETARQGKRKTIDEHRFEINDMENLIHLRDEIIARHYNPSRGVAFIVHDPVVREIVAAPFRDRVVHHFLFNLCADWWDRRFITDSYSCRKTKGTLYGQQRLAQHVRQVSQNYTIPSFAVKLDIQSYFMSLPHRKLFERVTWGLDQQFKRQSARIYNLKPLELASQDIFCHYDDLELLYQTTKYLWRQVIFDRPMSDIKIRGTRADWDELPARKSLFNQPPGQGLVIGNLTSQLLSNIYLDQLDRFVTLELGYKHYGRYVDDFFILVPMTEREKLLRDVETIRLFLQNKLQLTLHPKKQFRQPIEKGIPFIGAVIYPGFILPGKRIRRNTFAAAYTVATNGNDNFQEKYTNSNTDRISNFITRLGTSTNLNHRKLYKKLFDSFGWDSNWLPDSEYFANKHIHRSH